MLNNEIIQSIKGSKTICIVNKIDKIPEKKFPENLNKMQCEIENLKDFLFISCKNQINISTLISSLKLQVF